VDCKFLTSHVIWEQRVSSHSRPLDEKLGRLLRKEGRITGSMSLYTKAMSWGLMAGRK